MTKKINIRILMVETYENMIYIYDKDAKCAICLDKLNQPTITNCKHIFCNKCIDKSI